MVGRVDWLKDGRFYGLQLDKLTPVYIITFKATDSSGNSTTVTAKVTVPHSQNGSPAVDSGPQYMVFSAARRLKRGCG